MVSAATRGARALGVLGLTGLGVIALPAMSHADTVAEAVASSSPAVETSAAPETSTSAPTAVESAAAPESPTAAESPSPAASSSASEPAASASPSSSSSDTSAAPSSAAPTSSPATSEPTPTPTPTSEPTATTTPTPSATPTVTPTATPTASEASSPTSSPVVTPEPSASTTSEPVSSPGAGTVYGPPSSTPPTPAESSSPSSPSATATPSAPAPSTPTSQPVYGPPTWTPTATPSGAPTWSAPPAVSQPRWTTDGQDATPYASADPGASPSGSDSPLIDLVSAGPALPSPDASATFGGSGRHVDPNALVDALREGAQLQQGSGRHVAEAGDGVQLLSAPVDGGAQLPSTVRLGSLHPGTSLGSASGGSAAVLNVSSTSQRTATDGPDAVLLFTTVGAALALAGTALETARRQRVRAAVARGRGRRALR
ncbi:hypothetical protein SAMN06264364_12932 [Quadrisphaera granulorum]|uniref:Uncharacterized protein n=1 Tax=Quadrisphaera granulorum TaxID=317664 RepID=A0A315ZSX4_9ACTN|nr:hypothetical protein BXY45_12932 [Quadrisphaera granulorum]SZE98373.1 hypothetical protein SAMN06264364_12932 [Quadrisphaera granulorum]